jgi:hypothetical protein
MKRVATLLCILCTSSFLWAQSLNVSGIVRDEAGEPLPGVTVIVKNTIKGAVTGNDGRYFVEVPAPTPCSCFPTPVSNKWKCP